MAQPGGPDSTTDSPVLNQAGSEPGVGRVRTDWESLLEKSRPWLDRVGSLVAAGLTLFAAYKWGNLALELTNPCGTRELSEAVCNEVPELLQGLQLVLAIVGTAVAVLLAALTLFQAVSGRGIPRLRLVVAMLASVAVAWGAVYVVGWGFLRTLTTLL